MEELSDEKQEQTLMNYLRSEQISSLNLKDSRKYLLRAKVIDVHEFEVTNLPNSITNNKEYVKKHIVKEDRIDGKTRYVSYNDFRNISDIVTKRGYCEELVIIQQPHILDGDISKYLQYPEKCKHCKESIKIEQYTLVPIREKEPFVELKKEVCGLHTIHIGDELLDVGDILINVRPKMTEKEILRNEQYLARITGDKNSIFYNISKIFERELQ